MTKVHKDALQGEVVVGHRYGYTTSQHGVTKVIVGRVTKLGDNTVRFQPESIKTFYGGEELKYHREEPLNARSLSATTIFPAPTAEEADLGNGLTLKYLWEELDKAIGAVVELESIDLGDPYIKRRVKKQGDQLSAVFKKVQLSIDQEQQRQHAMLYELYKLDPSKVDEGWREYFTEATLEEIERTIGRAP